MMPDPFARAGRRDEQHMRLAVVTEQPPAEPPQDHALPPIEPGLAYLAGRGPPRRAMRRRRGLPRAEDEPGPARGAAARPTSPVSISVRCVWPQRPRSRIRSTAFMAASPRHAPCPPAQSALAAGATAATSSPSGGPASGSS